MTKLHPLFEQALAPFLTPVATRNDEPCRYHLYRVIDAPCTCSTPYPHCRQKAVCAGKGSCPLDPTCGD
jgi:hypothetical protein